MRLTRRTALRLSLALAPSLATAASDKSPLRRFIKMRGALDNRLVIGCVTGAYQGVVNGKTTPLFGLVSAVFSKYQAQPGGYAITEFEQAYYTDLETGKVLTHWKNPYTNETIAVPTYNGPVERNFVTEALKFHGAITPPPAVRVEHVAQGPDINGANITFVERVSVSVAAAAGKPGFRYQDHTSLRAKLGDVDDPHTATSGSATNFAAACSWRPWLNMQNHAGQMTASGQGRFGVTLTGLPGAWLEATSSLRPDLLKHPETKLE